MRTCRVKSSLISIIRGMTICASLLVGGALPQSQSHASSASSPIQNAIAVWRGRECVQLNDQVEAFAPMVDGKPDMKQVHLKGLVLKSSCMTYEVRH